MLRDGASTLRFLHETRIAWDGRPYTRLEFMNHNGEAWNARWEEASIATAGGAPQPAAAAGPGGPCTPAQLSPPALEGPARLRPWTIAGAPQPGAAAGPSVPGTPGQQPPQAQAAPTNAGAPQPGAVPVGVEQWSQVPFFAEVLPMKGQELANLFPNRSVYLTLRAAIDGACGPLYPYLPS